MRRKAILTIFCAAAFATAGLAQMQYSGTVNNYCSQPGGFCNGGGSFTLTIGNLPTSATGSGTLQLSTVGDYSVSFEAVGVSIDGLNLGIILNNNGGDDRFNFPNGDGGSDCASTPHQGTATLTEAELNAMLADGSVTLTFQATSTAINDLCGSSEFMSAVLTFTPAGGGGGGGGGGAAPGLGMPGKAIFAVLVLLGLGLITRRSV
jgi:hypothetical protein